MKTEHSKCRFKLETDFEKIISSSAIPAGLGLVDELVVQVGDRAFVHVDPHGADVEGCVLLPTHQGSVHRAAAAASVAATAPENFIFKLRYANDENLTVICLTYFS